MNILPALDSEDLEHTFRCVGEAAWQELRGARLFVTGGTGFVGKWLLSTVLESDRRLELGLQVTVLSRRPEVFAAQAPQFIDSRVQLVQGDVRDFDHPPGAFSHVVHAATDVAATADPLEIFDTCVEGTRRVLDFAVAAGAKEVLLLSSGAVYGRQPSGLAALPEDYVGAPDPLQAHSAYGEGKRVAEWLAFDYGRNHRLNVRAARLFAVVGPYLPLDGPFAIGNFMSDALAGRPIVLRGDGTPWRSYLHAADMAAWLWSLLLRSSSGAYNVGGSEALPLQALAERIARIAGSSSEIRTSMPADPTREAERYVPDVGRIRRELGLPQEMSLDQSIARTAQWLQRHCPSRAGLAA